MVDQKEVGTTWVLTSTQRFLAGLFFLCALLSLLADKAAPTAPTAKPTAVTTIAQAEQQFGRKAVAGAYIMSQDLSEKEVLTIVRRYLNEQDYYSFHANNQIVEILNEEAGRKGALALANALTFAVSNDCDSGKIELMDFLVIAKKYPSKFSDDFVCRGLKTFLTLCPNEVEEIKKVVKKLFPNLKCNSLQFGI